MYSVISACDQFL